MTLVVPFDGSNLAEAALVRAAKFGSVFDQPVVALSVVPEGNSDYARDHGWLGPDEEFDVDTVVASLRGQVSDLYPSADFRHEVVDRYASPGVIAKRVRRVAKEEDAAMVFVGSENAGRLVSGLSSVGATVATDQNYDVVIIRHPNPAGIDKLREASPETADESAVFRSE